MQILKNHFNNKVIKCLVIINANWKFNFNIIVSMYLATVILRESIFYQGKRGMQISAYQIQAVITHERDPIMK